MSGTVYLVGAGPGAPDLLTLRAARLLGAADIVLHDALVHPGTLELAVKAVKVAVGKRCGRHSSAQRFINKRLVDAARRHAVVVRLKGGDPMLFGRAQEEIDHLRASGIVVEVVPGVTAACAASAELGASLTQRGVARSVAFVTPRVGAGESDSQWARAAAAADTVVLYMAAGEACAVRDALIAAGMPAQLPAAVVESASLETSQARLGTVAQLESLLDGRGDGPVVMVLGRAMAKMRRAGRVLQQAGARQ
ncbi:MAG: uroporphyrinogen-III C-methyltransferase [Burkholderiales bacterium]